MHRILIEEKRWISEDRFLHALSYCSGGALTAHQRHLALEPLGLPAKSRGGL